MKISKQELVALLKTKKSASAMTFVFKTNKLFKDIGLVEKTAKVNVMANSDYERKVQKTTGNNEFKAKDGYGINITNMLVEKDGQHYVRLVNPKVLEKTYKTPTGLQDLSHLENDNRPVSVRNYKIENIISVTMDKTKYEIEEDQNQ